MSAGPYDQQATAARDWLAQLRPREVNGRKFPGDRAAIAKLKRSSNVMDAAAEPVTADLFKQLGFKPEFAHRDLPRAAVVAAVLAHVKDSSSEKLARAIGTRRSGEGSTPLVTPLRLKRLLAAREPDEVLITFRRVVAILGHTANVKDLAHQLLAWTDGEYGNITRTRFAFEYHGAGNFAPGADTEPTVP